ncbi:hypothetical protein A9Q78_10010 [Methylophaga sp. 41_12_T18]|nr:hypothetical protein A9Q78_10010 [Methylophaga sp. 41_12_T18]
MRILILIAIGLLLYIIIGNLFRKKKSLSILASEKMVKCRQCGVHVTEKEAVQSGTNYFCSHEHLDEHNNAS